MSTKKLVVGVVLVVLIAAGAYTALTRGGGGSPAETGDDVLPPVKAENLVMAEAVVVPAQYAILGFPLGGTVAEVLVSEGEQVEEGQVLLRLDARDMEAELRQAQAGLESAQAGLQNARAAAAQAKANLEHAKTELERIEFLFEQDAVSRQEFDQARNDYAQAETNLELQNESLAQAEVSLAEAGVNKAQTALSQTEIRAPFAGTVSSIGPQAGDIVSAGTPVVWLGDLSKWHIKTTDLTELAVSEIQAGDPVTIKFDAISDFELPGRVSHISDYGEQVRGDVVFDVTIEPDRHDERLRWNMTASVTIRPE